MDNELHILLANIWYFITGFILVLYVILDGFDLGVGILTLVSKNEEERTVMMASLGSVWDANETWLVLLGGALFGAFPAVYAAVLHALYIPIVAMLFGLIFRGVALEFRSLARNKMPWNAAFGGGSLLAATAQGFALGGVLGGLPLESDAFHGGVWEWLTPYSTVGSLGVVVTYVLFGSTYLVMKAEGDIQAQSIRRAKVAAVILLAVAMVILPWTLRLYPHVAERWAAVPAFHYLTLLLALSFFMLLRALSKGRESSPFFWSILISLSSVGLMVISHYPYFIPLTLTIQEAASPSKTLIFMMTGIGVLMPVMLIYNGYQYLVFRGKVHVKRRSVPGEE